ncbi:MAG TPA: VanZ family protein [Polyangiaceae bacterium]|nr:VanZ family protein [Polyangiaceae bacterium]
MSSEQAPQLVEARRGPGGILALAPALLWLGTTFYVGSMARDPLAVIEFDAKDKVLHALFFGVMQRTHFRALLFLFPKRPASFLNVRAAITTILVGILLELWQAFLPHRSAELLDAVADAVGAVCFAWLFGRLTRDEP